MDISIIIPAYNSEKTIKICLENILKQISELKYEIIIVDDGSTDSTKDIILSFDNNKFNIKYLWQENQKQSVARNNGLNHATGKYIFFFDSDDIVSSSMIVEMFNTIEKNDSDLVICGIKKIFIQENGINREVIETKSALEGAESIIDSYLVYGKEMDVGLWNKIFKRSVIEAHNIRFENGNFFEDSLFVLTYLLQIKKSICFMHKPFYELYKRVGSTTTNFNEDIVYYAENYLKKTQLLCGKNNIMLSNKTMNAFIIRLYLHIIHHYIKYSTKWDGNTMKKLGKVFNVYFFTIFHNNLALSYKLASMICFCFPITYSKLYKKMFYK